MHISLSPIEKQSGKSISQQIVDLVLKNVQTNQLCPGDKLPTERDLAERLGVSRGTVKNAYKKLEQMQVLQARQGSGNFVKRDETLAAEVKHRQAEQLTDEYVGRLLSMGMNTGEISRLVDKHLDKDSHKPLDVAVVYSNTEMLLDFKKQLSALPGISVSIFILASITEDPDPERLMSGFSLIIVPTDCYEKVVRVLPNLGDRMIEVSTTPDSETLIQITALPRDCRIGIISRTSAFLAIVKDLLISFGFEPEKVLSFFEMNYTVETYFPGGINALISFGDAHIFTDPAFIFRNEELLAKGGTIISFQHQLERGSMLHVEERIQRLLEQKSKRDEAEQF